MYIENSLHQWWTNPLPPPPPPRRKKQDNPYDQNKMGYYNLFSAAQGIHIVFTYREGKGTNV